MKLQPNPSEKGSILIFATFLLTAITLLTLSYWTLLNIKRHAFQSDRHYIYAKSLSFSGMNQVLEDINNGKWPAFNQRIAKTWPLKIQEGDIQVSLSPIKNESYLIISEASYTPKSSKMSYTFKISAKLNLHKGLWVTSGVTEL